MLPASAIPVIFGVESFVADELDNEFGASGAVNWGPDWLTLIFLVSDWILILLPSERKKSPSLTSVFTWISLAINLPKLYLAISIHSPSLFSLLRLSSPELPRLKPEIIPLSGFGLVKNLFVPVIESISICWLSKFGSKNDGLNVKPPKEKDEFPFRYTISDELSPWVSWNS